MGYPLKNRQPAASAPSTTIVLPERREIIFILSSMPSVLRAGEMSIFAHKLTPGKGVNFKKKWKIYVLLLLLGTLQGLSGLLTLEQFFPLGGFEGPPCRLSQGGGLNKHIWNFPLNLGFRESDKR
jgi:hypothetical protein